MTAVLKNSLFIISILFIGILLIACMQSNLFSVIVIDQTGWHLCSNRIYYHSRFPVFSGGVSCIIGIVVFGPAYGFIYNNIGVLIGLSINFLFAKRYGKSIILKIISEETYNKYKHVK